MDMWSSVIQSNISCNRCPYQISPWRFPRDSGFCLLAPKLAWKKIRNFCGATSSLLRIISNNAYPSRRKWAMHPWLWDWRLRNHGNRDGCQRFDETPFDMICCPYLVILSSFTESIVFILGTFIRLTVVCVLPTGTIDIGSTSRGADVRWIIENQPD